MTTIVLATERLRLVPFEEIDFPLLADLHSDPEVNRYLSPGPEPMGEEEVRRRLEKYICDHRNSGISKWKLETLEGDFVGRAGFSLQDLPAGYELGYSLKRDFWGRGYATEIARALVDWFFEYRAEDVLTTYAVASHEASQRVMVKSGFCFWQDRVKDGVACRFYRIERQDFVRSGLA